MNVRERLHKCGKKGFDAILRESQQSHVREVLHPIKKQDALRYLMLSQSGAALSEVAKGSYNKENPDSL